MMSVMFVMVLANRKGRCRSQFAHELQLLFGIIKEGARQRITRRQLLGSFSDIGKPWMNQQLCTGGSFRRYVDKKAADD